MWTAQDTGGDGTQSAEGSRGQGFAALKKQLLLLSDKVDKVVREREGSVSGFTVSTLGMSQMSQDS